jgi:hypothetical protein
MAGGRPAAVRATGPFEGDEASDDLLGLAAPDAVLLAGPDRERQAVVTDHAGRADGEGLSLELRGVGEERVVLGRDDIAAGGFITPAANLAHAAVPSSGRSAPAVRLAWRALTAARERRAK